MTNAEWAVQGARIGPLRQAGQSLNAIARETGISRKTVKLRLKILGLTSRPSRAAPPAGRPPRPNDPLTAEEIARMLHLHVQEGRPADEVAALLGRNHETVCRRLRQLGALRPTRPVVVNPIPAALEEKIPHACHLARETLRRLALPDTPECNQQDWYSLARLYALQALASYRPDRGCNWATWVIQRVRWDLGNELRRTSPYTRGEWKTLREDAVAADPGLADPTRAGEWEERELELVAARKPLSWEQWCQEWEGDEETWSPHRPQSWVETPDPCRWLLARAVREAIAALPAPLRYVVQQHQKGYVGEEIARDLGISESRVHQLHDAGRERLREALAEWA